MSRPPQGSIPILSHMPPNVSSPSATAMPCTPCTMMRAFLRGRRRLRTPALCRRCRTPCPGWTEHRTWQAARWRARLRRDGVAARRDYLGGDRAAAARPGPPRMPCPCTKGRCTGGESEGAPWRRPGSRAATYSSPHPPLLRQGQGRRGRGRAGPGRGIGPPAPAPPSPAGLPPLPASRQFHLGLERGLPARQVWHLVGRPADDLVLFSDGLAPGPDRPGLAGALLCQTRPHV